jgi:hypothetical protein
MIVATATSSRLQGTRRSGPLTGKQNFRGPALTQAAPLG